ncbi:MAG: helix-turn-helix domain-containing protein [Coleofasciculus sp. C3-bin4]|nr:helix-turn-helix domain-containing protein [Coleofasciculus sp. C3-bin4]
MPQYRALHTKLKLNNKQKSLLAQHPEAARFTWNWALEICNAALPTGKCSLSAIDLHNRLAAKAPIGRVLVLQSPHSFGSISGAEYPERFPKMG